MPHSVRVLETWDRPEPYQSAFRCHPKAVESLASQGVPTKDLCTTRPIQKKRWSSPKNRGHPETGASRVKDLARSTQTLCDARLSIRSQLLAERQSRLGTRLTAVGAAEVVCKKTGSHRRVPHSFRALCGKAGKRKSQSKTPTAIMKAADGQAMQLPGLRKCFRPQSMGPAWLPMTTGSMTTEYPRPRKAGAGDHEARSLAFGWGQPL